MFGQLDGMNHFLIENIQCLPMSTEYSAGQIEVLEHPR